MGFAWCEEEDCRSAGVVCGAGPPRHIIKAGVWVYPQQQLSGYLQPLSKLGGGGIQMGLQHTLLVCETTVAGMKRGTPVCCTWCRCCSLHVHVVSVCDVVVA